VNLWAQVPHYVHTSPSPKATLAIVERLRELLGIDVPHADLTEQATAWEENIDQLASEDDDMMAYIHQLENSATPSNHREASGDAIAQEFERYLQNAPSGPGGVARRRGLSLPHSQGRAIQEPPPTPSEDHKR
jgi:Archaeal enzymes of ATP-grasp superfamily